MKIFKKLLKINTIESNGLLAHSALSPGDLVLAINGFPCKSPDEAAALILESSFKQLKFIIL